MLLVGGASEHGERATRTERAGAAARERVCSGVRGAKAPRVTLISGLIQQRLQYGLRERLRSARRVDDLLQRLVNALTFADLWHRQVADRPEEVGRPHLRALDEPLHLVVGVVLEPVGVLL